MESAQGNRVPLETRKALLEHNGDITTHYTAAELQELLNTAEMIVDRSITQAAHPDSGRSK
ncbi:MAG: hypothetical protein ABW087_20350 [Candidatus Thiodiazotropha sp.]